MSQGKSWCFTLNNPTEPEKALVAALLSSDQVEYGIVGREVSSTGTPHLQGYVRFNTNKRFRVVRGLIPRAHVERARGSADQNRTYCAKAGDSDEYGTIPVGGQGHRSDLDDFIQWGETFETEKGRPPTSPEVALARPHEYLKYPRCVRLFERRAKIPDFVTGEPRAGWQDELAQELDDAADSRKIIFYVGREGGEGKTWFQQYFLTKFKEETQIMSIGKRDDIAHTVNRHTRYFFFNVPRGQMEFLSYSTLECLKDRLIFSPKYASQMKALIHTPHVVVFSNEEPDDTKLSRDRYDIRHV